MIDIFNYYIFINTIIFLLFIFIISIFGNLIFSLLKNVTNLRIKLSIIENYIISFGIGLSFIIFYSFIIASFRIMNFFTLNLPIILVDLYYIGRKIRKGKLNKTTLHQFCKLIKESLLKKENRLFLIIFLLILIWHLINTTSFLVSSFSLYVADPFYWFNVFSFVTENGFYPEEFISPHYPQGYSLANIYCLFFLIKPEFITIYFFLKFMPILFLVLFIIIFSVIIKKIFNKNYILFISLVILTRANFFNYRFLRYLPSNLATLMVMISLLLFINNFPFYFQGILTAAIFLINPMVAFYYILVILIYLFIKYFNTEIKLKVYFKDIGKFFFLFIFTMSTYIFFLLVNGYNIFDLIFSYLKTLGIAEELNILSLNPYLLNITDLLNIKAGIIDFLTSWFPNDPWYYKLRLQNSSLIFSAFFLFGIIGLFMRGKRLYRKNCKNLSIILKSVIITVLLLLFLPIFFQNNIFFDFWPYHWALRVLEVYCVPIILIECSVIYYIVEHSNNIKKFLIKKFDQNNQYTTYKYSKVLTNSNILILFLILSSFTFYYIKNDNNIIYSSSWNKETGFPGMSGYYFKDDQIKALFFIRENIPNEDNILVPYFDNPAYNRIYKILWDYNLTLWDYNLENSYNKTIEIMIRWDINYILIDRRNINITQLDSFNLNQENFSLIYENSIDLIFRLLP